MKVLTILAQKGGAGKTTIAVHLAICAKQNNLKTALIDLDPQGSAYSWNHTRPDETKLDAIQAEAEQLPGLLKKARKAGAELVIIDTAPHSNHLAAIAANYADLILIPCRPARFDLEGVQTSMQIAGASNKKAAIVINAAPRGKLAGEARQALEKKSYRVLTPILTNRVAYSHAVIGSLSVHEYEPNGKATAEINELYTAIKEILNL